MITLSNKYSVIIPRKDNNGITFSNNPVGRTIGVFARKFGGATAVESIGGWIDSDNNLVVEPVTIVYSYSDDSTSLDWLESYAIQIKRILDQDSVAFEYNNTLYLTD